MRTSPGWLLFIGIILLLDFYVFQGFKAVAAGWAPRTRQIVFVLYWTLSIASILLLVFLPLVTADAQARGFRTPLFAIIIGAFFAKVVTAIFFLIDDIRRGLQWIATKTIFSGTDVGGADGGEGISRSHFLTWLGIAAGGTLFATLLAGFRNKYNYRVHRVPLSFKNLPKAFHGLKVVQLSDIHSGSFTNKAAVQHGVDQVMALKPDVIFFTGDLVNNIATEIEPYVDVFNKLQAPMGVYSILGNHDYGDYFEWETPEKKVANLDRLKSLHAQMGWRLLLNEHVVLENGGEKIGVLGVENWSNRARFPKYGRLPAAHQNTDGLPFKILLSHDPSHWEAQVVPQYKDIDLMLAGHTHGMQFGVEIPWLKWSPVQYVYKQWAGLYQSGDQHLYVNRGFGFIGYPGRVGILPEITLLQLNRA